jgi:hypothetical protein
MLKQPFVGRCPNLTGCPEQKKKFEKLKENLKY